MSIAKTGLAAFRSDTTTTARVLHTKGYWTGGSPSTSQGLIMAQSLWVLHRARELCYQVHTVALEYVYRYDRASMTSPRHNRPRTKSQSPWEAWVSGDTFLSSGAGPDPSLDMEDHPLHLVTQ